MEFSNYIIIILVLFGAFIMLMSATYTKKIFNILSDRKLKENWKKLRLLILVFFAGYLAVVVVVVLGKTELLALLSGVIFFMGSLFVFIVVRTGLDSFTKLKELNEDLEDTQFKNNELEQFAYITSHDLKTPIRGISSLASFIKHDIASGKMEEVDEHLSTIQRQVVRLENLINGILNYSKIGKITLEPVNLDVIVHEELENYRNLDNVIFTVENKLPIVEGDKIQLSQVFANLIGNTIKHNNKEVCEVWISSIEKLHFYEIIIEDNGPGIETKYHQKIFEVFQTLGKLDADKSTGIGLSIVKKIVEKHRGNISVTSGDKLGAKFIISYPKTLK